MTSTMRIESVSGQPDRVGRYKVKFTDGTAVSLYKQTVQDFGLYAGLELSDEEFRSLQEAASRMSAKMRAVRIVSAGSVSKKNLQHRLIQKGENPDDAKAAVSWLSDMNILDDKATAEQIVSRCISKGYGIAKAKQALYEKQIPKAYWEEVLADYPDQTDAIRAYIENHLPQDSDQKTLKKVIDALIRKGHSYGTIRSVLNGWEDLED